MYTEWTTHNRWKIWSKGSNHEHANGWDTRSWPSVPMQYREPVDRYELGSIHITRPCLLKLKRVMKWLVVILRIQLDFAPVLSYPCMSLESWLQNNICSLLVWTELPRQNSCRRGSHPESPRLHSYLCRLLKSQNWWLTLGMYFNHQRSSAFGWPAIGAHLSNTLT